MEDLKITTEVTPIDNIVVKKKRGRPAGGKNSDCTGPKKPNRKLKLTFSPLLGDNDFTPTGLQIRFMQIWAKRQESGSPASVGTVIREDMGHKRSLWQYWKKNPKFMKWFQAINESYHTSTGLCDVHNAIYNNAVKSSPQDRKLYLERFDDKYKPQTSQSVSFVGSRPLDNVPSAAIVDNSRKFVESHSI